MRLIIVDEHDNVIGSKERDEVMADDIHRVASLWVTDSKGRALLQQRSLAKKHNPGIWTSAVAGSVEVGETYESNIYKEAQEEIGLTGLKFTKGPKQLIPFPDGKIYLQWYAVKADWPLSKFTIQKEELEGLAWVDVNEFASDSLENPDKYSPGVPFWRHLWT